MCHQYLISEIKMYPEIILLIAAPTLKHMQVAYSNLLIYLSKKIYKGGGCRSLCNLSSQQQILQFECMHGALHDHSDKEH